MGRARIIIWRELLAKVLQLPNDVTIQAFYVDPATEMLSVILEGETLEPVPQHGHLPNVYLDPIVAYDGFDQQWMRAGAWVPGHDATTYFPWGTTFHEHPHTEPAGDVPPAATPREPSGE